MVVGDAHVFPGFLRPVLIQLSLQSHRLLFSHASAEVRGENTPERKFALTGNRTRIHQVMSDMLTTEPPRRGVVNWNEVFLRFRLGLGRHNAHEWLYSGSHITLLKLC